METYWSFRECLSKLIAFKQGCTGCRQEIGGEKPKTGYNKYVLYAYVYMCIELWEEYKFNYLRFFSKSNSVTFAKKKKKL